MNYPINTLTDRIEKHQDKVKDLENSEPEMQIDLELSHNEVENHLNSIEDLQTAIKILLKHNKR